MTAVSGSEESVFEEDVDALRWCLWVWVWCGLLWSSRCRLFWGSTSLSLLLGVRDLSRRRLLEAVCFPPSLPLLLLSWSPDPCECSEDI